MKRLYILLFLLITTNVNAVEILYDGAYINAGKTQGNAVKSFEFHVHADKPCEIYMYYTGFDNVKNLNISANINGNAINLLRTPVLVTVLEDEGDYDFNTILDISFDNSLFTGDYSGDICIDAVNQGMIEDHIDIPIGFTVPLHAEIKVSSDNINKDVLRIPSLSYENDEYTEIIHVNVYANIPSSYIVKMELKKYLANDRLGDYTQSPLPFLMFQAVGRDNTVSLQKEKQYMEYGSFDLFEVNGTTGSGLLYLTVKNDINSLPYGDYNGILEFSIETNDGTIINHYISFIIHVEKILKINTNVEKLYFKDKMHVDIISNIGIPYTVYLGLTAPLTSTETTLPEDYIQYKIDESDWKSLKWTPEPVVSSKNGRSVGFDIYYRINNKVPVHSGDYSSLLRILVREGE